LNRGRGEARIGNSVVRSVVMVEGHVMTVDPKYPNVDTPEFDLNNETERETGRRQGDCGMGGRAGLWTFEREQADTNANTREAGNRMERNEEDADRLTLNENETRFERVGS
jgi:hypothetical protein